MFVAQKNNMSVVVVASVAYLPDDIALVAGTVDGVDATAYVWQSAIDVFPDTASQITFCATALKNMIPAVGTVQQSLTGQVTI
jgi:hypothetical protein